MIKYVSNAFLAKKISFINEISVFCEKVNAKVQEVEKHGIDYVGVGLPQGEVEVAMKEAAVSEE